MNKAMKFLVAAAFAVTTSGAAVASVCAYVNDNVAGPNATEGYKIGPGNIVVHVGPYSTNGRANGTGFFAGGLAVARVAEGDLYVSDGVSENITHFTINKTDCTLTRDPSLYPSGDTIETDGDGLAITPDGRTMFVGSTGERHIYSHTIAANGSLGAAFTENSTSDTPDGIEISPDGHTLVVAFPDIRQVCAYPISGGHLDSPNCQSTLGLPAGVSVDPASACVYAAESSSGGPSEIAAFTLIRGVLGNATDYNPFGPGENSNGILVNWDNQSIYVSNTFSAQVSIGSIGPGCKLAYRSIISDGVPGMDDPAEIAQGKISHDYVVTGDYSYNNTPSMGIFHAHKDGTLAPVGSGRFPLMRGYVAPLTVVVVGAESP